MSLLAVTRYLCAVTLLAALPAAALADVRAGSSTGPPSFSWSHDPQTVVISFAQIWGEFRTEDQTPLLQVHGDGRVRVHWPVGRRDSGDWEMKLDREEMHSLVASLVASGVMEFDATAARSAIHEASRQRIDATRVVTATDPTLSTFVVQLSSYGDSAGRERDGITRTVRFAGIRRAAEDHAGVAGLAGLAQAEQLLLDVTRDERLERVQR